MSVTEVITSPAPEVTYPSEVEENETFSAPHGSYDRDLPPDTKALSSDPPGNYYHWLLTHSDSYYEFMNLQGILCRVSLSCWPRSCKLFCSPPSSGSWLGWCSLSIDFEVCACLSVPEITVNLPWFFFPVTLKILYSNFVAGTIEDVFSFQSPNRRVNLRHSGQETTDEDPNRAVEEFIEAADDGLRGDASSPLWGPAPGLVSQNGSKNPSTIS